MANHCLYRTSGDDHHLFWFYFQTKLEMDWMMITN